MIKSDIKTIPYYRFSAEVDGVERGRAFLFLVKNDLHPGKLYGLLEDVWVDPDHRGTGLGTELVKTVVDIAREYGCYKLVATSRFEREKVHALYERIGFERHGIEFRMELELHARV